MASFRSYIAKPMLMSVLWIADHGSEVFHPGSWILGPKDSGSQIHIKEFKYF